MDPVTLGMARRYADRAVGETLVNVRRHGALGTYNGASGSDDTSAILDACAEIQASGMAGTLWFPPRPAGQRYRCTSPLPNISGLRIAGPSRRATRLQFVGCDMFALTSGSLSELVVEGLYLSTVGGHLFNLTGSASLTFCSLRDVTLYASSLDKSILYQNGSGDVLENWWTNFDAHRQAGHTVPAWDIRNSSGGANSNVWKRGRISSSNCPNAPAIRVDSTVTGSYAYGNSFEDIVGEQNPGGLIHLLSNNNANIKNCQDWDATVTYIDHVIKIDKSAASTTESRNITVANSGRFGGTLGPGIKDVYASPNSRAVSMTNCGNHTTTPQVQGPSRGATISDETGLRLAAGDVIQTGRNTTANRPTAGSAGAGAMFYDSQLSKPIWSDGSVWRDAAGTAV